MKNKWVLTLVIPLLAAILSVFFVAVLDSGSRGFGPVGAAAGVAMFIIACVISLLVYIVSFSWLSAFVEKKQGNKNKVTYFFKVLIISTITTPIFLFTCEWFLFLIAGESITAVLVGIVATAILNCVYVPNIANKKLKIQITVSDVNEANNSKWQ